MSTHYVPGAENGAVDKTGIKMLKQMASVLVIEFVNYSSIRTERKK